MTAQEFVDQLAAIYQHNQALFLGSSDDPYSPKKNAIFELRKAAGNFVREPSEKHRKAVEGATYECETIGILSKKETKHLIKDLHKVEKKK